MEFRGLPIVVNMGSPEKERIVESLDEPKGP